MIVSKRPEDVIRKTRNQLENTYYRINFDPHLLCQWFLDTPVRSSGDEWAFWRILRGEVLHESDLGIWRTQVKQNGQILPFSFAGFGVPIVNQQVGQLIVEEAPGQVQLLPLAIEEENGEVDFGYRILVATQTVRCVDEGRSEFIKWGSDDMRPDKVGEYRMITRLRLDASLIPSDLNIFRVWGWKVALVVAAPLPESLRTFVKVGLNFEPVS